MQIFTTIELYSGDTKGDTNGTQRDFEAEVAMPQLIDKGKQSWCGEHNAHLELIAQRTKHRIYH